MKNISPKAYNGFVIRHKLKPEKVSKKGKETKMPTPVKR